MQIFSGTFFTTLLLTLVHRLYHMAGRIVWMWSIGFFEMIFKDSIYYNKTLCSSHEDSIKALSWYGCGWFWACWFTCPSAVILTESASFHLQGPSWPFTLILILFYSALFNFILFIVITLSSSFLQFSFIHFHVVMFIDVISSWSDLKVVGYYHKHNVLHLTHQFSSVFLFNSISRNQPMGCVLRYLTIVFERMMISVQFGYVLNHVFSIEFWLI